MCYETEIWQRNSNHKLYTIRGVRHNPTFVFISIKQEYQNKRSFHITLRNWVAKRYIRQGIFSFSKYASINTFTVSIISNHTVTFIKTCFSLDHPRQNLANLKNWKFISYLPPSPMCSVHVKHVSWHPLKCGKTVVIVVTLPTYVTGGAWRRRFWKMQCSQFRQ